MKLLKVGMTHCDLLAEMHAKCFNKSWTSENFKSLLTNKFNEVIIISDEKETPMGFVMYQNIQRELEILTICTLPDYRKQGVAKKLINSLDGDKIFLDVDEGNLPAVNLYKTLHFKVETKREKYYSNGNTALVMSKNLKD